MGTAYNELGDYKKAKTLLEPISVKINNSRIYNVLTQAYVKSNDSIKLLQFMDRFALTADSESLNDLNLLLGKTFLVAENSDKASNHFNAIVDNNPSNKHLAESYYYNNDFEKAEDILLNLYKEDSEDFGVISKLGVSYYKNGKVAKATELINSMENLRTAYQFGSLDYALAQYYAAIGEKDKAIESLEKSIANGYLYRITSYHNDSHFIEYLNDPKFQDVLTYWH